MSLFNDLSTLEAAGLIRVAKMEPDLEYNFLHTLVQDAAYASLLEGDRKRLHLAVGDAIESLYPDRRKELAALLAHHFREAGQDVRALIYFLMAGDEALAAYANQEAEILYRRGLDLICCSDEEIARLYTGLGEALYRQSRFNESLQAMRSAIDIYKESGASDGIAKIYARLGRILWYQGSRPEGLKVCLEGLDLVKDAPESKGKASLMHETARAYHFNGMSDKALPLCRQALLLAGQFEAPYLQADALATLGILSGVTPEESLDALRKSVELAEANGFYQVGMRAHQNLGTMVRTWLLDNETALKHFHRSAELGKMRGAASEEIIGLLSYTSSLFRTGRIKEIEAALPRLDELVEKISNPIPMQVAVKNLKGILSEYRGDWDTAIAIFRECLNTWHKHKNLEGELNLIDVLTWVLLEKNRWGELEQLDEIEKLLADAIRIIEQDNSNEKMWAYPRMAILRARQGALEEAHAWLERVQESSVTIPSAWNILFQGECEVEIASAEQNWSAALEAIEKLTTLQVRSGLRTNSARDLLCWADLHIRRGTPADIERGRVLLRESLTAFEEIGMGHYPDIAQKMLQMVRSKSYAQALDHENMTKDLKKARHVQESLLPANVPSLPGWGLAVVLNPAHETSGDFYDFLPLPDGRLGLIIADVTDKGTSAALFMALSRSLYRTFAADYPDNPEKTMSVTNHRILADTHGGLFITLFYGILNPLDGTFTYCSAGHYPAYLVRAGDGSEQELSRTGIPLGVLEEGNWNSAQVTIEHGDTLVLYTDGITDATNTEGQFFGKERLLDALRKHAGKPAREILDRVLSDVHTWMGDAQQFDDITLMVITREKMG